MRCLARLSCGTLIFWKRAPLTPSCSEYHCCAKILLMSREWNPFRANMRASAVVQGRPASWRCSLSILWKPVASRSHTLYMLGTRSHYAIPCFSNISMPCTHKHMGLQGLAFRVSHGVTVLPDQHYGPVQAAYRAGIEGDSGAGFLYTLPGKAQHGVILIITHGLLAAVAAAPARSCTSFAA